MHLIFGEESEKYKRALWEGCKAPTVSVYKLFKVVYNGLCLCLCLFTGHLVNSK